MSWKTKIFNHKQYQYHRECIKRTDAVNHSNKLRRRGYDAQITTEYLVNPSVSSSKRYVVWKRKVK